VLLGMTLGSSWIKALVCGYMMANELQYFVVRSGVCKHVFVQKYIHRGYLAWDIHTQTAITTARLLKSFAPTHIYK
jgi:hypothetical protein